MLHHRVVLAALLFGHGALAAPRPDASASSSAEQPPSSSSASHTSSAPAPSFTAGLTSDDPNDSFYQQFQQSQPEPVRGALGAPIIGPDNIPLDRQSPDFLAPPTTDAGSVLNAKWPFAMSHNRIQTGGWARQQNVGVMPIATQMAGVNMRLAVGAIRELHWHLTAEWAFVLKGTVRITAVTPGGGNYEADVESGDIWYFAEGIPHSLQATDADPDGAEFLLVFDDGSFSEDATFLISDWMAHVPKEVLAKNFQLDMSAFHGIPKSQLYIFPGMSPPPISQDHIVSPSGNSPLPMSFPWSKVAPTQFNRGTVKVIDSTVFNVSKTIASALVTVEVGGMRELHWHPTQAEWTYFIEGVARITIFAANGNSRTFDYVAGDVGYVPPTNGHMVENIGNTTLTFLELTKTSKFEDISLRQWLALTPAQLVKAHTNLNDSVIAQFNKNEVIVV